jgi:hypothetical protein
MPDNHLQPMGLGAFGHAALFDGPLARPVEFYSMAFHTRTNVGQGPWSKFHYSMGQGRPTLRGFR